MKELDLLRAMDGADDAILLEAEMTCRRRSRLVRRIALVAAVIALLSVTVYAAYGQVELRLDEENDSYWFEDFEYEGIQYTRVTFAYDLEPVRVNEKAVKFLEDMLAPCDNWLLDGNQLLPAMNYYAHKFASLEIAENFFGIRFQLPEMLRGGAIGSNQVQMDAKAMYYPEDAPRHEGYNFSYEAELGGASLFCNVLPADERLHSVGVSLYLGLTEEFCAQPYEARPFYAMDLYGEPKITEKDIGDEEFTILTFPDSPDRWVEVFYVRDGIGYDLKFYPNAGHEGDLERLVYGWLKDLG